MRESYNELSQTYVAALQFYLSEKTEAALQEAYELGRKFIADGLGIIDMARIHQNALMNLFQNPRYSSDVAQVISDAGDFFAESLSPFEMTQRGFRDANFKLKQANSDLEKQTEQLTTANSELKTEISERKRVELELRESKEHYRDLFDEARRMQDDLRRLSSQILHAQEEERKRISRELHDEVGQALTAINVNLTMLRKAAENAEDGIKKKIADAQVLLEQTMETVHRFSRELRPAMLDDLGLIPALRCYISSFTERTGVDVSLSASPEVENLGSEEKLVLFRVAQESLTNIAKHAQATYGWITIRKNQQTLVLEVQDNGRSFQMDQVAPGKTKRLGLLGMQERVRLVNGDFKIKAEPGKGTTIWVEIPIKL